MGSKKLLQIIVLFVLFQILNAVAQDTRIVSITVGQSEILDFVRNVKRIAVANSEIADAIVTTPTQALVTGKAIGTTNLYIWNEAENYERIRVSVVNESAPYQVNMQVKFIEIKKSALLEFGSNFMANKISIGKNNVVSAGSFAGNVGDPPSYIDNPMPLGSIVDFFIKIPKYDIESIFKALQEKDLVTLLASPNISARDGSEASFLAGGEIPIPIVSGSAGMQQVSISYKEYGVRLKFTPTVLSMDMVNLKLESEVSSLDFDNGIILSGWRIPALDSRKASTTVELNVGEYLILGGLLSNSTVKSISRIPVLGHIPVLGLLFSSTRYLKEETELIVTVSPTLITSTKSEPQAKTPVK
jgi:pilus assembly protein CpaC